MFPIRGIEAWMGETPDHVNSQVTQLLCIGLLLRGDSALAEEAQALARSVGAPQPRKAGPTAQSLSVDRLRFLVFEPRQSKTDPTSPRDDSATLSSTRAGSESVAQIIQRVQIDAVIGGEIDLDVVAELWSRIQDRKSARSALVLLGECIKSVHDQVRAVSAAVLSLVHEQNNLEVRTVLEAFADGSGYAYEFAAIALELSPEVREEEVSEAPAGASPRDESGRAGQEPDSDDPDPEGSVSMGVQGSVSMVVHGTFARLEKVVKQWYRPNAELPNRIRASCSPNLYRGVHYFRWSGGYSDLARTHATDDLLQWCAARQVSALDTVYAHSHGGNVVLEAIDQGLEVRLLVLLHTPVLPRSDAAWRRIQSRTGRILDIRTQLDWVVLLDGLKNGSKNSLPSILGNARPLVPAVHSSFQISHTRYIKDSVWQSHGLTGEVGHERSMVP